MNWIAPFMLRAPVYSALLAGLFFGSGCSTGPAPAYVDRDARTTAELVRADRLRADGQHSAAAAAYAGVARELRDSADPRDRARAQLALFWCGEEHYAARNLDAAFDAYCALFRDYPNSSHLTAAASRCLDIGRSLLDSRPERGELVLQKVTEVAPYTELAAEAHTALGRHYYAHARFADAKSEFDLAARTFRAPEGAARAELVAALCEFRLIERPPRNFDRITAAENRLRRLRTAPLNADDMQTVDRHLKQVQELAAEGHFLLAQSYLRQRSVVPALAHLREILDKYPATPFSDPARQLLLLIQEEVGKVVP